MLVHPPPVIQVRGLAGKSVPSLAGCVRIHNQLPRLSIAAVPSRCQLFMAATQKLTSCERALPDPYHDVSGPAAPANTRSSQIEIPFPFVDYSSSGPGYWPGARVTGCTRRQGGPCWAPVMSTPCAHRGSGAARTGLRRLFEPSAAQANQNYGGYCTKIADSEGNQFFYWRA